MRNLSPGGAFEANGKVKQKAALEEGQSAQADAAWFA